MKTLTKILLLVLTLALSACALASCGDDGEISYREVTEEEWKAAYKFDNATMVTTEKVYTDGKLSNQYTNNVYFVDGISYDANGNNQGAVSAYEPYFAFVDCYGEFAFDSASNKYSAAKVTVKNIEFEKVVIAFSEDGKLSLIEFSADNDGNDIRVTVNFSKFGETTIPEREAFVAEGKDYCSYKTSRDLEGKKLAYITIKIKNYGNVKLVLDASVAPKTVAHFLKMVNEGFYDGLTFCRIVDDFMVQGGDPEKNASGFYADDQARRSPLRASSPRTATKRTTSSTFAALSLWLAARSTTPHPASSSSAPRTLIGLTASMRRSAMLSRVCTFLSVCPTTPLSSATLTALSLTPPSSLSSSR